MTQAPNARRRWLLGAAASAAMGTVAQAAPRQVHGAHDAWAESGIALAWGVLRGRDENSTRAIIRIEVDLQCWARIEATGRDPFSAASADLPMLQHDDGRCVYVSQLCQTPDWPGNDPEFTRDEGEPALDPCEPSCTC